MAELQHDTISFDSRTSAESLLEYFHHPLLITVCALQDENDITMLAPIVPSEA
jgi:hypothetical protein